MAGAGGIGGRNVNCAVRSPEMVTSRSDAIGTAYTDNEGKRSVEGSTSGEAGEDAWTWRKF